MSDERMLWGPFNLKFEPRRMSDGRMSRLEIVEDVESLARGVMGTEGWPVALEPADNDELLGFLLSESVVLERRYAPRDGIEARPWLFQRLRWAARDWRERRNRHGWLSEAEPVWDAAGEAGAEAPGDRGDSGVDALRGLLETGDRDLLREIEALGLSAPPGTRGRTPRARRRLATLDRQRRARVEAEALERGAVAA